jgi:hypothetical protein
MSARNPERVPVRIVQAGVSTLSLTLLIGIFPLSFRCTTTIHAHVEGICHVAVEKERR